MKLTASSLGVMASLMNEAAMDLAMVDSSRIFLADELGGSAAMLRHAIPEITELLEARDTLCRKHFEDTLFRRYWANKIHSDPKTGLLVPGDVPDKEEVFKRSPVEPEFYNDDLMESAWQGYKLAFKLFKI